MEFCLAHRKVGASSPQHRRSNLLEYARRSNLLACPERWERCCIQDISQKRTTLRPFGKGWGVGPGEEQMKRLERQRLERRARCCKRSERRCARKRSKRLDRRGGATLQPFSKRARRSNLFTTLQPFSRTVTTHQPFVHVSAPLQPFRHTGATLQPFPLHKLDAPTF